MHPRRLRDRDERGSASQQCLGFSGTEYICLWTPSPSLCRRADVWRASRRPSTNLKAVANRTSRRAGCEERETPDTPRPLSVGDAWPTFASHALHCRRVIRSLGTTSSNGVLPGRRRRSQLMVFMAARSSSETKGNRPGSVKRGGVCLRRSDPSRWPSSDSAWRPANIPVATGLCLWRSWGQLTIWRCEKQWKLAGPRWVFTDGQAVLRRRGRNRETRAATAGELLASTATAKARGALREGGFRWTPRTRPFQRRFVSDHRG